MRAIRSNDGLGNLQNEEEKMTIIEIVKQYLEANGFDGLVQPDAECGCDLSDLQPCSENFAECRPAYKHPDPTGEGDWVMHERNDWVPNLNSTTPPVRESGDDVA